MKVSQHGTKHRIVYRVPGYNKPFKETFDSIEEANVRLAELELDKKTGVLSPPILLVRNRDKRNTMFSDFLDLYVRDYGLSRWKDSYLTTTKHRIEHYIKPFIGQLRIRDLDSGVLTHFYSSLPTMYAVQLDGHKEKKKIGLSVMEKVHCIIHSALEQAIKWGYVTTNADNGATFPKYKNKVREIWSREEAIRAIETCADSNLKIALYLAIICTMRIGEINGLQWEYVNVSEETIADDSSCIFDVHELKRCNKADLKLLEERGRVNVYLRFPELKENCSTCLVLTDVKTDSSVRRVYVPETVAHALLEHRKKQQEHIESCHGLYNDYGLVIAQDNGRPLETRIIDKRLKQFISENGYETVVFHSFRALSTTDKLQLSGGDIKAVQGDTGHASPKMVTEQYSRIRDLDRKRLAGLMDQAYFGRKKVPQTTPDEDAALSMLRENPEVLKLLLAMRK